MTYPFFKEGFGSRAPFAPLLRCDPLPHENQNDASRLSVACSCVRIDWAAPCDESDEADARICWLTSSQCAANTLSTNCRADSLRLKVSARARASSLRIERAASAARPRFASSTPAPLSPITSSGPIRLEKDQRFRYGADGRLPRVRHRTWRAGRNHDPHARGADVVLDLLFQCGRRGLPAERVKAGRGRITGGPMEVPGGQWIVQKTDPQGSMFALVAPRR